jgi:glyoxylase-like metal-dependent hydrolase (beta-lactamase superfamily II)
VEELRPGLWRWTAPHPDWTPAEGGPDGWEQEVGSYAYDAGGCLVVIDALEPPSLVEELAAGKELVALLTTAGHRRSAKQLAEELGATVYAPADRAHLVEVRTRPYRSGETLPGDVVAQPTYFSQESILWIAEHRALVIGDIMLGRDGGVRVPEAWLPDGVSLATFTEPLKPLLELPVELVLPTHGEPVRERGIEALARALGA